MRKPVTAIVEPGSMGCPPSAQARTVAESRAGIAGHEHDLVRSEQQNAQIPLKRLDVDQRHHLDMAAINIGLAADQSLVRIKFPDALCG